MFWCTEPDIYMFLQQKIIDVGRLFSEAGDILPTEHNRLLPTNAKMILLLREWLALVKFDY